MMRCPALATISLAIVGWKQFGQSFNFFPSICAASGTLCNVGTTAVHFVRFKNNNNTKFNIIKILEVTLKTLLTFITFKYFKQNMFEQSRGHCLN